MSQQDLAQVPSPGRSDQGAALASVATAKRSRQVACRGISLFLPLAPRLTRSLKRRLLQTMSIAMEAVSVRVVRRLSPSRSILQVRSPQQHSTLILTVRL